MARGEVPDYSASGLTKTVFARRAGIPKTRVVRLFSLTHHSRLDWIESDPAALGVLPIDAGRFQKPCFAEIKTAAAWRLSFWMRNTSPTNLRTGMTVLG